MIDEKIKPYNLENYSLNLIGNTEIGYKIEVIPIGKGNRAFDKERRKIYIIFSGSEIYYVGEASSSIKIRLQRGCSAYNYYLKNKTKRLCYGGYQWLNSEHTRDKKLYMTVAVFTSEFNPKEKRPFIKAIEGELTYIYRKEEGKWPLCQNEIHFSNDFLAQKLAKEIYERVLS